MAKKKIGAERAVGLARVGSDTAIGVEQARAQVAIAQATGVQKSKTEPYKWGALAVAGSVIGLGVLFIVWKSL